MDNREFFEKLHLLIHNAKAAFSSQLLQVYKTLDIAPSQIGVLRILKKSGSKNIGDLSERLSMPDSNISAICRKLEKRGLLERTRDETDQRIVNVRVTQEAVEMMEQLEREWEKTWFGCIDAIPDQDKEDIVKALEKLNHIFKEIKNAPPVLNASDEKRESR